MIYRVQAFFFYAALFPSSFSGPCRFAALLKAPVHEAVVPITGLTAHIAFATLMAAIARTTAAIIATSIADRWPRYHTTATAATKVTQA